jgi:hypothetical protein
MNKDQSRLLDWLEQQGWAIAESCANGELEPVNLTNEQILARFEADEAVS